MTFSAVILAGGRSTRMGCDKAFLPYRGQTLLAHQVAAARRLRPAEVFISGRAGADYPVPGCRVVHDAFAGEGPLLGVERALDACVSPLLLVLAVDMPEVTAGLLRRLLRHCSARTGAVPQAQDHVEPLAAIYPKSAHSLARTLIAEGSRSVARFAELCVGLGLALFVPTTRQEQRQFANWNSPADVTRDGDGPPSPTLVQPAQSVAKRRAF